MLISQSEVDFEKWLQLRYNFSQSTGIQMEAVLCVYDFWELWWIFIIRLQQLSFQNVNFFRNSHQLNISTVCFSLPKT